MKLPEEHLEQMTEDERRIHGILHTEQDFDNYEREQSEFARTQKKSSL